MTSTMLDPLIGRVTVYDNGTLLGVRRNLNFIGITLTDDPATDTLTITGAAIPAGGTEVGALLAWTGAAWVEQEATVTDQSIGGIDTTMFKAAPESAVALVAGTISSGDGQWAVLIPGASGDGSDDGGGGIVSPGGDMLFGIQRTAADGIRFGFGISGTTPRRTVDWTAAESPVLIQLLEALVAYGIIEGQEVV
jgi:hypothetical protein